MSTRKKNHRNLQLEFLESRTLLAGTVLAAFNATTGILTLTGDAKGNGIAITTDDVDGTWTLTVTGTDTTGIATRLNPKSTKVNAASASFTAEDVHGIVIDMKDGRNEVSINVAADSDGNPLALSKDLTLKSGKDADYFQVDNIEVAGKLTVSSGAGADFVSLGWLGVTGAVSVDAGSGGNYVFLEGDFTSSVSIKATTGIDYVSVSGTIGSETKVGSLTIDTGANYDTVDVSAEISGNVTIKVGDGGSEVHVEEVVTGNLSVTGGSGSDYVYVSSASVGGKVDIKTGAGDDGVCVGSEDSESRSTITGSLSVDTGTDDDWVELEYVDVGSSNLTAPRKAGALAIGDVKISTGDGGELRRNYNYEDSGMPFYPTEVVVALGLTATGNLAIDGGKGDNGIVLAQCSAANATLTTGAGSSMIAIGELDLETTGTLSIQGGVGDNAVAIGTTVPPLLSDYLFNILPEDFTLAYGVHAGKVAINTGSVDSGEIAIENSQVDQSVTINVKGGDVNIAIRNLQVLDEDENPGNVSIQTDKGDDVIAIDGLEAKNLGIKTGAGNDTVTLDAVTADSALLDLGAGDDYLGCGLTTANAITTAKADGGANITRTPGDTFKGPLDEWTLLNFETKTDPGT